MIKLSHIKILASRAKRRRGFDLLSLSPTLLANLAIPALGAVSGVVLARALGPSDRGTFAFLQALPMVMASIAAVGMSEALAFFVAQNGERRAQVRRLGGAVFLALIGTTLVLLAALGLSLWVEPFGDRVATGDVRIAVIYCIPLVVILVLQGWFRGLGDLRRWNLARVVPTLCWMIAVVVVWFLGTSVSSMTVGLVLSGILASAIAALLARRSLGGVRRLSLIYDRELLNYGMPSVVSSIPRTLNLRIDQLVLLAFVSTSELGRYVSAVAWSSVVVGIASVPAMNSFPRFANALAGERLALSRSLVARGLLVATIAAALIAVITPVSFGFVFGDEYSDAAWLAVGLLAVAVAQSLMTIITNILLAIGKPKSLLMADVVALGVTMLGLATLPRWIGVWGAIVTSALSYLIASGIGWKAISKEPHEIRLRRAIGSA